MKLEDNSKPADGPKMAPESNKPSRSKARAQDGKVESGTAALANSNDTGTSTTYQFKTRTQAKSSGGPEDSRLLLDTHEAGEPGPLVNADITNHSASISPGNEENHSSDENGDHDSAPVTSASQLLNSGRETFRKKRSRRKPAADPDDPNPAKTILLKNFLEKCKTTPCKYFCNPKNARVVDLDCSCADTQSSLWGEQNAGEKEGWEDSFWGDVTSRKRKIPYCRYGNNCNFAHPHPEQPDKEYKYDDWEKRILGLRRRGPRTQDVEYGEEVLVMDFTLLQF